MVHIKNLKKKKKHSIKPISATCGCVSVCIYMYAPRFFIIHLTSVNSLRVAGFYISWYHQC